MEAVAELVAIVAVVVVAIVAEVGAIVAVVSINDEDNVVRHKVFFAVAVLK